MLLKIIRPKLSLVEIKAQFSAPCWIGRDLYLSKAGWGMLKTIKKNTFDAVAGLMIIAAVFYLAAITHIMPMPENALNRINEIATDVMDVLVACGTWLISFLP